MSDKSSRLMKGIKEKNKSLIVLIKAALTFYLCIFSIQYFISGTDAYFVSSKETNLTIKAGWSHLEFVGKGNQNIRVCPADVEVKVKNEGAGLANEINYEIHYSKTGNPEKGKPGKDKFEDSVLIYQGTAELNLESYQTGLITFIAEDPGVYKVKLVNEHSGSNGEVWSEKIQVCNFKSNNGTNSNDHHEDNSINTDIQSPNLESDENKKDGLNSESNEELINEETDENSQEIMEGTTEDLAEETNEETIINDESQNGFSEDGEDSVNELGIEENQVEDEGNTESSIDEETDTEDSGSN